MKKILINALHAEEIRVAMLSDGKVYDLEIEARSHTQTKSNIYLGKVKRVVPSLEAVFIDYGAAKQGFLPLKEVASQYFSQKEDGTKEIKEGQDVIIQIVKEDRWNKGAALTTFVSIAGKYLVIMPDNPEVNGVSKRINNSDREALRAAIDQLSIPKGMGVIARTAGISKSIAEMQQDLNYLVALWASINQTSKKLNKPALLFEESGLVIRVLRDYLQDDVEELIIDNPELYQECLDFVGQVIPPYKDKVKLYKENKPLFSQFEIESQIKSVFQREVTLPSGGVLVIDTTEAMVTVDINSAKATSGSDIGETALNTNLEAAEEISRQLRLRDIGGLIVIDFIDMYNVDDQKKVEQAMEKALRLDRVKVQISALSKFGLMEMSRQRLKPALNEINGVICPRCQGQGRIRDTESFAVLMLRLLEEAAHVGNLAQIQATLPANIATYLLNGKRQNIGQLEQCHDIKIVVVPSQGMHTPDYEIVCIDKEGNLHNFSETTNVKAKPEKRLNASDHKKNSAVSWGKTKQIAIPKVKQIGSLLQWLFGLFKKPKKKQQQRHYHNKNNNNNYKKNYRKKRNYNNRNSNNRSANK